MEPIFVKARKWNWLIILAICLLFIAIIIFLGIKSNLEVNKIVQEQFSHQQLLVSRQISIGIDQFLNEKTVNLEILVKEISDEPPDKIETRFKNVYEESSGIYVIQFINESGVVTLGYPEENTPLGYDLYEHEQEWAFERVEKKNDLYITSPLLLFEGELGVFIWTPVFDGDEYKGAVLAIIKISDISDRFLETYDSPGEIYLIDKHGTILYDSSNSYPLGEKYPDRVNGTNPRLWQILQEQMNGSEGTGYYFVNNTSEKRLIAYSPITWQNQRWSVAVESPVSEVDKLIHSVYLQQGLFIGVSGLFILMGSLSIILLLARWNRSLELEVENTTRELKKSNELFQKANKKLMELDKLKSDFVSMVSHELKTPLTAIKTSAEYLLHNDPDQPVRKEMNELIIRNINRQTRIVDDLLDLSRIESGRIKYRMETVDLSDIITTAVDTIKKQPEARTMDITIDIPDNLSKIQGDRDKLIQVFLNLLDNALKFTTNRSNVEIRAVEFEKSIEVSVKDNGVGIPPDKLNKIFDKFYQIDNTSARVYGGSGLGLAITRGIVEGHGGTIRVESSAGEGSVFILTLNK